jgi:23S rRNA pseudoU1915 N3-methylase RlmH
MDRAAAEYGLPPLHTLPSVALNEVGVGSHWNSSKYEQQKQLEVEVNASFNIGGSHGLSQPNKQATRKHQISSLAFQAAKTQLSLLESKATRAKTKYETQSKYGW